jgi:hypothetical protein
VKQLEILARDWVFVAFAQEAQIVGALQVFNARRVAAKFLVIGANRPRILHSAVNHLLFAVPPYFELDGWHNRQGGNRHHRNHQQQRQQNVATLPSAKAGTGKTRLIEQNHEGFSITKSPIARLLN